MYYAIQPVLAVLLFASPGSAQHQVPAYGVPEACAGGQCPRPASQVTPARDAVSIGTQILLLAITECIKQHQAKRAGSLLRRNNGVVYGVWDDPTVVPWGRVPQHDPPQRMPLLDGQGWRPGKVLQRVQHNARVIVGR